MTHSVSKQEGVRSDANNHILKREEKKVLKSRVMHKGLHAIVVSKTGENYYD